MQNNPISIRITSLYGSQPSSVVIASKTATFGTELQVSMGPRHRLLICACETAQIAPESPWVQHLSLYSIRSQPSSVVFACKTATLGPELQVSMGPSSLLWFCALTTAEL